MHTETYIADDNATLISKNFRDLKKYLDMVSHGQISIPYLTRFKKVIINNARSDFCVDEVKLLLSRKGRVGCCRIYPCRGKRQTDPYKKFVENFTFL